MNDKLSAVIHPIFCRIPTINLTLSAAVLFNGGMVTKFLHMLNSVNAATHTDRSYTNHKTDYLHGVSLLIILPVPQVKTQYPVKNLIRNC